MTNPIPSIEARLAGMPPWLRALLEEGRNPQTGAEYEDWFVRVCEAAAERPLTPAEAQAEYERAKAAYDVEYARWKRGERATIPPRPVRPHTPGWGSSGSTEIEEERRLNAAVQAAVGVARQWPSMRALDEKGLLTTLTYRMILAALAAAPPRKDR